MAERDLLGASLEALTDDDPPPLSEFWPEHDLHPSELAATTPVLQRLQAVLSAARNAGVLATTAVSMAGRAAGMRHHRGGALSRRDVLSTLVGAGIDAQLFQLADVSLHPGPDAHLVVGHPLGAWWEALEPVLFGDPLDGTPERGETAVLLPLLFQYITSAHEVELDPCVNALHEEWAARREREGRRPPTRQHVRRCLASLLGFLVEFGLIDWRPSGGQLGSARTTTLGAFGFATMLAGVHGPSPGQEELLREAGYLPAEGGYVHRSDVPVDICPN